MGEIKYYFNLWRKFERFLAELISCWWHHLLEEKIVLFVSWFMSGWCAQMPPSASLCLIHTKTPPTVYNRGLIQPKEWKWRVFFFYSRPEKSSVLSEEKWKLIDDVMKQNGNSRQAQCMKIVQHRGRTIRLVCDTEKDGFKKWCVALLKYSTGFEKIA